MIYTSTPPVTLDTVLGEDGSFSFFITPSVAFSSPEKFRWEIVFEHGAPHRGLITFQEGEVDSRLIRQSIDPDESYQIRVYRVSDNNNDADDELLFQQQSETLTPSPNTAPQRAEVQGHQGTGIIKNNAELSLTIAELTVIDAAALSYTHPTGSELTYTLTATSTRGALFRGGVELTNGDTFTQSDINNGLVTYRFISPITSSIGIAFTVSDGTLTLSDQTLTIIPREIARVVNAAQDNFLNFSGTTTPQKIDTEGGSDTITSGDGDDQIDGGAGDDTIFGVRGKDQIEGGAGDDTIHGGQDDDRIDGGAGNDAIHGGLDDDRIEGGAGDDRIHGGQGEDQINGDAGDDNILGGRGEDQIEGGDGNDTINGGQGDDQIEGGAGDDDITLTRTVNNVIEDAGADEVFYTFGYDGVGIDGGDAIMGFKRNQDKLTFIVSSHREITTLREFLQSLNGDDGVDLTDDDAFIVTMMGGLDDEGTFYFDGVLLHFKEAPSFGGGRVSSPLVSITFDERLDLDDLIEILGGAEKVADNFDSGLAAFKNLADVLPRLFGEDSIDFEIVASDPPEIIPEDDPFPADGTPIEIITIYENHPLNKVIFDFDPPQDNGANGPAGGGIFSLERGRFDNDRFRVDAEGKIWVRELVNFENPTDNNRDNIYRIEVTHTAADGTKSARYIQVEIEDILLENNNQKKSTTGASLFNVDREDYSPDELPSPEAQSLLSGYAFSAPDQGPLILTWSFGTYGPTTSRLTSQENIDLARLYIEQVFEVFESVANLKFIEVGHNIQRSGVIGDITIAFEEKSENAVPPFGGEEVDGLGGLSLSDGLAVFFGEGDRITENKYLFFHEIGHALGLFHPSDASPRGDWSAIPESEFDNSILSSNTDLKTLTSVDIEILQWLYGAPETNFETAERFRDVQGHFTNGDERVEVDENISTDTPIYQLPENISYQLTPDTHISGLQHISFDSDLFILHQDGGLFFRDSPDFENPTDAAGGERYAFNNVYEIHLTYGTDDDPLPLNHLYIAVEVIDVEEPLDITPDVI